MHTQISPPLTSLQLELLKIYSFNPDDEDLQEIKTMLGKYFSRKFIGKINTSVEKNNINDNDLENWLDEDNR